MPWSESLPEEYRKPRRCFMSGVVCKKFLPMTLVNKVHFTLDSYIESNKGGNCPQSESYGIYAGERD